jgi:hypothetical protein
LSIHVDLLEELPLLVFVDDETLRRVFQIAQSPDGPDAPLVDLVALVESPRLCDLMDELAESPLAAHPEASCMILRELVPGLRHATGCVEIGDVPQRLFNLLGRHHALGYQCLSTLRLRDLLYAWEGAGVKSAGALLAEAIDVGLRSSLAAHRHATSSRESESVARANEPATDPTHVASGDLVHSHGGDLCAGYRPSEAEIAVVVSRLMSRLPSSYAEIADRRLLAPGKKPTLETLGQEMGVTRERIRQIERKAEQHILQETGRSEFAALQIEANRLRNQLGSACMFDQLSQEWPHPIEPRAAGDRSSFPGRLLLWLAGPYVVRGEWLIRRESGESLEHRTLGVIEHHLVDGMGDLQVILEALGDLGIRESARYSWLQCVKGYRVLDGTVLAWGASMSDKAAAVLQYRSEPLTAEELAALIGRGVNLRSLKNALMTDPRIKRVGKLNFGLRDWKDDEYTTVSDEIAEEIARQGGEATIAHLVEVISPTYGVSEASVRAYASSRRFIRTRRGALRVASPDEICATTRPVHLTKGCYLLDESWSVRVRITGETLRGSGTSVPESFIALFGIRPNEAKELSSDYGAVKVSWGHMFAYLGSLRCAVEELRGAEGDLLFVKAVAADRLEFDLVRQAAVGDLSSPSQLAALVAWGGLGPRAEPLACVCHAMGLVGPAAADSLSAATRIRARRELELLPLVEPDIGQPTGQDAMDEILSLLGCELGAQENRA